jgi:hypothetical protein
MGLLPAITSENILDHQAHYRAVVPPRTPAQTREEKTLFAHV